MNKKINKSLSSVKSTESIAPALNKLQNNYKNNIKNLMCKHPLLIFSVSSKVHICSSAAQSLVTCRSVQCLTFTKNLVRGPKHKAFTSRQRVPCSLQTPELSFCPHLHKQTPPIQVDTVYMKAPPVSGLMSGYPVGSVCRTSGLPQVNHFMKAELINRLKYS